MSPTRMLSPATAPALIASLFPIPMLERRKDSECRCRSSPRGQDAHYVVGTAEGFYPGVEEWLPTRSEVAIIFLPHIESSFTCFTFLNFSLLTHSFFALLLCNSFLIARSIRASALSEQSCRTLCVALRLLPKEALRMTMPRERSRHILIQT